METKEYFIMRVKFESKFLQHTQLWKFKLGRRNEYETSKQRAATATNKIHTHVTEQTALT
jgi:hypothetical protein